MTRVKQSHGLLAYPFIRMVTLINFIVLSPTVNSQDLPEKSELQSLYPKRLVSNVELLVGSSVIYPSGSEGIKEARVGKLGFAANAGFTHVFNSRFGLNLKLGYENKGYKLIIHGTDASYNPPAPTKGTIDFTLNYATLSILPQYSVFKRKQLTIGLGPYLGYLATEKNYSQLEINGVKVAQSSSRPDPHLVFKELDMGVKSMLAYQLSFNQRTNCTVQFIHSLGLVDIIKDGTPIRNNTFSLLFGLTINNVTKTLPDKA